MADTPNLNITLLTAAQAQKHVTVNEALQDLDAIVQLSVIDRDLTSPPGSPSEGDRYILGGAGTGGWLGIAAGCVVIYINSAWTCYSPTAGWRCFVEDESAMVVYDGSNWISDFGSGYEATYGGFLRPKVYATELTGLSGATATATGLIPTRCVCVGVTSKVSTAITGATSFDCGDGTTADRFGGTLGIALDSENIGVLGPFATYSATDVVLTANGGNFTAGAVILVAHVLEMGVG
jgi:hypothetical protein